MIHVRVMHGEHPRSGHFSPETTIADIIQALFTTEIAERRTVRLIFGGAVRPNDVRLQALYPNRAVPEAITLHAVVSTPGTDSSQHHSQSREFGDWSTQSSRQRNEDDIELGPIKMHSTTLLLFMLGLALAALWILLIQRPHFFSTVSGALLTAFTAGYAWVIHSRISMHSGQARPNASRYQVR
jgi:hypothetical protein